ncbi:MAG: hypothetical protein LJE67_16160 [Salaquimonas sp.]|nr:hypothetical protein [Salaquimonas sp.]
MNDELDPGLQILFANAEEDLANDGFDDAFAGLVMAAIERQRRASRARWIVLGLAGLAAAWFFADPLAQLVYHMSEGLTASLVPANEGTLMQMLTPLNSVAGLIALLLLAGQMLWRRMGG